MLDSVARIFTRKIFLRFAISVEDVVDGGITVAVDGDLIACAVEQLHHLDELLPVAARVAAVAGIAHERRVIRLDEIARIALNGSILHELHRAELQALIAEAAHEAARFAGGEVFERALPFHHHDPQRKQAVAASILEVEKAALAPAGNDGRRYTFLDIILHRPTDGFQAILRVERRREPRHE